MFSDQRTILHVDDDPAMTRAVAAILNTRDWDVVSLNDSLRALPTLMGRDIRVVLLDVEMPGMNGFDLLRKIKTHDGGIQVLMLTGMRSMNTVLEAMRGGAEACLFKPFTNYEPLFEALQAAAKKVDSWWQSLEALHSRRFPDVVGRTPHSVSDTIRIGR